MDEENILPDRKWLRHETPHHGIDRFPVFFITICCRDRPRNQLANDEIWPFLLETIKKRNSDGQWNCSQFLVMPDHLHGIFSFDGIDQMKKVVYQWKRWVAGQKGINWQKGFFDHRLRSRVSALEKREYIRQNPVRAGLVDEISAWPYRYDPQP